MTQFPATLRKRAPAFVGALAVAALLAGCATSSQRASPEAAGPPLPYGPIPSRPGAEFGPEAPRGKAWVVVLPAGGARAFAHAGVLRALAEAKIPIGAIVASELGSLVGALFVTSPTLNEFEWNLQRFPNELFALDTSLVKLLRPGSKRKELKKRLLEVLGQKNGEGLSPPLYTLLPRGSTGELVSVGTALSLGVEAGIGLPGDESELSYAGAQLMPVSLARGLDIGPVIFVDLDRDAEGGPRSGVNPAEASRADLIIQPELAGVLATDYGKRSEIIYRGKQATRKLIPKIREALNGPGEGT